MTVLFEPKIQPVQTAPSAACNSSKKPAAKPQTADPTQQAGPDAPKALAHSVSSSPRTSVAGYIFDHICLDDETTFKAIKSASPTLKAALAFYRPEVDPALARTAVQRYLFDRASDTVPPDLADILAETPALDLSGLGDLSAYTCKIENILAAASNLKRLNLSGCWPVQGHTQPDLMRILSGLGQTQKLIFLDISQNHLLDNAETIDGLAKAVSSMPHLAHLKADDVPTFEPLNGQRIAKPAQPLQKLLRVLAGRSNVRSYDSFPPLSEASLPTFVQFLRNNPYLTHLRLEFAFETATLGPDFLKLCEAVAALKNLQSLQLCFGSLDPRAFDLLQGIVHNGFNLKHLALEAPPSPHGPTPHLVAASWRLGAKLVQESPHLQSLHLAYWPHTAAKAADPEAQGLSEAMGALEAALQKLESLASLKISGRLGSTDGIPTQPLYSLIASAASLRRLDLGFVGQSTTEVLHLLKSAAPLPRLEDLLLHLADEHLFNDDLAMAVASFKYLRRLKIRLVDSEEASTLTLAFGAMALPRLESFKLSAPQRHLTEPPDSPLTDAFPGLFALQGVTFEWED